MVNLQSKFDINCPIGTHGQLNKSFPSNIASRVAEASNIPFGVVVVAGTNDGQCTLPPADPSTSYKLGVSQRTQAVENDASGHSFYHENKAVSIVQKGVMYVKVADATIKGGKAYFKKSTGEIVATATNNTELVGAKFTTTVAAGGIAQLELDL